MMIWSTSGKPTLLRPVVLTTSLSCAVIAFALPGCSRTNQPASTSDSEIVDDEDPPYENGYAAYENVILLDGSVGTHALASGVVYRPDGTPCPDATVTAELHDRVDGKWASVTRCLHVQTDNEGKYEIRGEEPNGYSLYWAAAAGQLGVSYTPESIELRDGETIVHVRDESCRPISNATVTVHLSGIDDMSFIVPPNLRDQMIRTTDANGVVRYPSRLGDFDLGFEVKAPEKKILTRSSYSGFSRSPHKLFVISEDRSAVTACCDALADELDMEIANRPYLETGSPGHYHGE